MRRLRVCGGIDIRYFFERCPERSATVHPVLAYPSAKGSFLSSLMITEGVIRDAFRGRPSRSSSYKSEISRRRRYRLRQVTTDRGVAWTISDASRDVLPS